MGGSLWFRNNRGKRKKHANQRYGGAGRSQMRREYKEGRSSEKIDNLRSFPLIAAKTFLLSRYRVIDSVEQEYALRGCTALMKMKTVGRSRKYPRVA